MSRGRPTLGSAGSIETKAPSYTERPRRMLIHSAPAYHPQRAGHERALGSVLGHGRPHGLLREGASGEAETTARHPGASTLLWGQGCTMVGYRQVWVARLLLRLRRRYEAPLDARGELDVEVLRADLVRRDPVVHDALPCDLPDQALRLCEEPDVDLAAVVDARQRAALDLVRVRVSGQWSGSGSGSGSESGRG
eukprot:scaffold9866_cov45-Phaeocystis_antarctica.AAC.1